jgi:chromosome segregation ATPase
LYEAVRSDRNLYSKNLIEAQDEVADMRRKFGIASHQITQLKDEIQTKDQALSNEIYEKAEKEKEIQKLQAENKLKDKAFKKSEDHQRQLKGEISKLQYVISQMADEIEKIKKDYQNVINERDILGTQLIRRNDELALLYEKIKIL